MLTEEEKSRTRDFLKFFIAATTKEGGKVLVNKKTHMLYAFPGDGNVIPLFEKYEENYSTPIDDLVAFVYMGAM